MIYRRSINDIRIIIVHCSDSDNPAHDNIETIRSWHKERGFDDVGYHYYIQKSGKIQIGRSIYRVGAHCEGQNSISIGICLGGKIDFKDAQFISAAKLIDSLFLIIPNLKREYGIFPHRFFVLNKTCPNFELGKILRYAISFKNVDEKTKFL